MNYTIYILITTIIIIYLTVYSTICSSKEAFTNDHSNTNFTYSMKVFISDKGDHDKPSVQLSRTDKTPKNISEHEWANKHITKHEKTTPTHKETSKHAAEAEAAAALPSDADYQAAWLDTGCPSIPGGKLNLHWWKKDSESHALNDMYSYCTLARDGQADKRQMDTCCGVGLKCKPNCKKQGKIKGAAAAAEAEAEAEAAAEAKIAKRCPSAFPYPSKIGSSIGLGLCYHSKDSTAPSTAPGGSWCVVDDSPALKKHKNYFIGPDGAFKTLKGFPCKEIKKDAIVVKVTSGTPNMTRDILLDLYKQGVFNGKKQDDQFIVMGYNEAFTAKMITDTSVGMFLPWGSDEGALSQNGETYTFDELKRLCNSHYPCTHGWNNCKNGKCTTYFKPFTPESNECGVVSVTNSSCNAECNNIQAGSVFRADLGGCVKPKCTKSNIVSCAYSAYRTECPTECNSVYPAVKTKHNYCLTILNDVISNQSKYFKTPSSKYAFMRYETEPYMVKRSDDKIVFTLYDMSKNQNADVLSMGLVNGEPNQQWLDTWTNLYKTDSAECRMVHIFANGMINKCSSILNVIQGNYFRYFNKVTDTSFYASVFGEIIKIEMVIKDSKYLAYKLSYSYHPGKGFTAPPCYLNTPVVVLHGLKPNPTCDDIIKYLQKNNLGTKAAFEYNRPWGHASANWKYWIVSFEDEPTLHKVKITVYEFDGGVWKKLNCQTTYKMCNSSQDPRDSSGKCLWNKGNIPTGKPCDRHKNGDCQSNLCVNGKCTKCTGDSSCDSGRSGWWCGNGNCYQGCPSSDDPRDSSGKCLWNKGNIPERKACYGPGTTKGNKSCLGKRCVGYTGKNQGWCASQPKSNGECTSHYGAGPNEICCGQVQGWYDSIYMCPKNKPVCVGYKANQNWGKCNEASYVPIGCYKDKSNRALPHFLGNVGFVQAANYCANKARNSGYKYFGLQVGQECWAGNNLAHAKKYGQATCGLGGGAWKNYLYTLTNPSHGANQAARRAAASTSNASGDVYAVNSANQIYRKDSPGSVRSWRQPNPGARLSNVSATGKTNIWGVQSDGAIWRCQRPCTNGQWVRVSGGVIKQISADDQYVYGVAPDGSIWRRNEDGTGAWVRIPGTLSNITASGKGYIWGVQSDEAIYRCRKPCVTGKWTRVPGELKQVAADDKYVWGVNNANQIYKMPVDGSGVWTEAEASKRGGRLTWVSPSAPNYVWGVGTNKKLYYCKKPCTAASWSTMGAFNNAIQVEGDSTGTGGAESFTTLGASMTTNITLSITGNDENNNKLVIYKCTIKEFPLKKWTNLLINCNGHILNIYSNGKHIKQCIIPDNITIDPDSNILVTPTGGYISRITDVQFWDSVLTPKDADSIYHQITHTTKNFFADKLGVLLSVFDNNKNVGNIRIRI